VRKALSSVGLAALATLGCLVLVSASEGVRPGEGAPSRAVVSQDMGAELDLDYCYNYLAPYGSWVNMDPWGYVWCPRHMGYNWRPYTEGHWVWTDYGWTWISDFDWGWIPFHYGRWGWDDDLGWYWVPGTVWGPAWVTWRSSDLYCGWAPFPPGIEFRAGLDFARFGIDFPFRFWIFIGASHFCDTSIFPYVLPYERNITIINNTRLYSNFSWRGTRFINDGINVDTVQRLTRRPVTRYALQDARRPGRAAIVGNQVQLYRPAIRSTPNARPKTYLNQDQARSEIGPAKVFEPRQQPPKMATESDVQKRQSAERKLMDQSHAQELKAIDQQRIQEQRKVQAPADKARIEQDYQAKRSDVAKQHQAERQQITERHKSDTQQVKRAVQPKTQPKPQAKPKEKK
jgi:hypothetical protein